MNRRGRSADLIAEGHSNNVIAKKLVLSQRTVETHVTSIFSKLEIATRCMSY